MSVIGFDRARYIAGSRGKALAKAWGDYSSYDPVPFGDFLKLATAVRAEPPPRFGEPITVSGRAAFYVGQNAQYVQFVFPGSDVVLNSHPLDVATTASAVGTSASECTQDGVNHKERG